MADSIIELILELATVEEEDWKEITDNIPEWHPRNESGAGSGAGSGDGGDGGTSGESSDDNDDDDNDDDDDTGAAGEKDKIDWKAMARKHEREAKKQRKRAETAEKQVSERESADQTEQEKAIKAAREEGENKARSEAEKERRTDRLENATLKLASKGFKVTVKDGDEEKQVTLKFADPDDAFTYVERMVRRGEIEEDDIFDDKGKVVTETLTETLQELLEEKPHLQGTNGADDDDNGRRKVKGRADGGRGSGKGKAVDELSVEEHLKRIQGKT